MFNVNPTHNREIANSVQHDYQQAAAQHRLLKESGNLPKPGQHINVTAVAITLFTAILTVGQFIV